MQDLTGMGSVGKEIVGALSRACGTAFEPTRIVREAKARGEALQIETEAQIAADKLKQNSMTLVADTDDEATVLIRAGKRIATQESKRQLNIERIATEGLTQSSADSQPRAIDDDWMHAFIQYAQDISADGVRELWSTILSSQATEGAPAVSRATLDAMRLLEPKHARHFERGLQLFVGLGVILDVRPTDETKQSFNVNAMLAMALEDIGFLRRSNDSETALALRDCTLTFWNPLEVLGDAWPADQAHLLNNWSTIESEQILRHVVSVAQGNAVVSDGERKHLKIPSMQLTSRGFELAAVALPEAYNALSQDETHAHEPALGAYADPLIRASIIDEWATQFSEQGALVVKNQRCKQDGSKLVPSHYFDYHKRHWVAVVAK